MLETSEERIKLLRSGYTGKKIEELYIENNKSRKVNFPIRIMLAEITT